jgi:hypothetical protein
MLIRRVSVPQATKPKRDAVFEAVTPALVYVPASKF